jgi:hypothetical protein
MGGRQASDHRVSREGIALAKRRHLGLLRDGKAPSTALLKSNDIIAATIAKVNSFLIVLSAFVPAAGGLWMF